jgi:hypothetical protein
MTAVNVVFRSAHCHITIEIDLSGYLMMHCTIKFKARRQAVFPVCGFVA